MRKPESAVMRRIKAAVRQSSAATLNLSVGVDNHSVPISSALRQPGSRQQFLDVPLRAVIELGHKNFAKTAGSWRALLAGLHGTTWSDEAIRYFESEIGTQHFPAPDANLPLDLVAVGGMVGVSNGMHRATAAICWLAATGGDDAVLRKVRVAVSDVWPTLRAFVLDEAAQGHTLDFGRNRYGPSRRWLRVGRGTSVDVFELRDDELVHVADKRSPAHRLFDGARRSRWGYGPDWAHVIRARLSAHAADALRDDAWLREQKASPRYSEATA